MRSPNKVVLVCIAISAIGLVPLLSESSTPNLKSIAEAQLTQFSKLPSLSLKYSKIKYARIPNHPEIKETIIDYEFFNAPPRFAFKGKFRDSEKRNMDGRLFFGFDGEKYNLMMGDGRLIITEDFKKIAEYALPFYIDFILMDPYAFVFVSNLSGPLPQIFTASTWQKALETSTLTAANASSIEIVTKKANGQKFEVKCKPTAPYFPFETKIHTRGYVTTLLVKDSYSIKDSAGNEFVFPMKITSDVIGIDGKSIPEARYISTALKPEFSETIDESNFSVPLSTVALVYDADTDYEIRKRLGDGKPVK